MSEKPPEKLSGNGIKIGTTAIIWGFSTGMLAICIPLISLTHSNIALPLAVILGATISTIVVWLPVNS
jgi:flagellar motor switch protein FliM